MQADFAKEPDRCYTQTYCDALQSEKRMEASLRSCSDEVQRRQLIGEIQRAKVLRRKLPFKDASDKKLAYVCESSRN